MDHNHAEITDVIRRFGTSLRDYGSSGSLVPTTPAEAFAAAQDAALNAARLLYAAAKDEDERKRYLTDGTVGCLACRCVVSHLERCVDDDLAYGFSEVISDRIVDLWEENRLTDTISPPLIETCSRQLASDASVDCGVADAVAAAQNDYVEWMAGGHPIDPLSSQAHDIMVPGARLAAFDALAPHNSHFSATLMADMIAELAWQETITDLARSLEVAASSTP